ncbi:hypothetical protein WME91_10810 [Sorangium sp. So ce269]
MAEQLTRVDRADDPRCAGALDAAAAPDHLERRLDLPELAGRRRSASRAPKFERSCDP